MTISRFADDQIFEMRTRYRDGELQKIIAADYGIKQCMMSMIVDGRCYKNAPWPIFLSSGPRRSLPQFPGYEFDSDGNVYSFKCNKRYGRLMNPRPNDKGYSMVAMTDKYRRYRNLRINRIICTLFNGLPPTPTHQARHLNGIKTDNRAVNLAWGTQKDNEANKARHGVKSLGEKNGNSKLTEAIIRKMRVSRLSTRKLAEKYGVSQSLVVRIKQRKAWSHVLQYARC